MPAMSQLSVCRQKWSGAYFWSINIDVRKGRAVLCQAILGSNPVIQKWWKHIQVSYITFWNFLRLFLNDHLSTTNIYIQGFTLPTYNEHSKANCFIHTFTLQYWAQNIKRKIALFSLRSESSRFGLFFKSCVLYPKFFLDFPYFQISSPPHMPDGIVYNLSRLGPPCSIP